MEVCRTAGIQQTKNGPDERESQSGSAGVSVCLGCVVFCGGWWYGSYMHVVDLVVLRSGVGIDVGERFSCGIMDLNSASHSV